MPTASCATSSVSVVHRVTTLKGTFLLSVTRNRYVRNSGEVEDVFVPMKNGNILDACRRHYTYIFYLYVSYVLEHRRGFVFMK